MIGIVSTSTDIDIIYQEIQWYGAFCETHFVFVRFSDDIAR